MGQRSSPSALTLIEVLVVIVVVFGLLLLILPLLARTGKSRSVQCIYNLRQIGLALIAFASDNNGHYPMEFHSPNDVASFPALKPFVSSYQAIFREFAPPLNPQLLVCPTDTRHAASDLTNLKATNISYFLSFDATPKMTNTIVAGDRNLQNAGAAVKPGLFILTRGARVGWTREMHSNKNGDHRWGNLLFSDGSVRGCIGFNEILNQQDILTNRLIVP
jgi:type II secretory pathway pseudopilin PulG